MAEVETRLGIDTRVKISFILTFGVGTDNFREVFRLFSRQVFGFLGLADHLTVYSLRFYGSAAPILYRSPAAREPLSRNFP